MMYEDYDDFSLTGNGLRKGGGGGGGGCGMGKTKSKNLRNGGGSSDSGAGGCYTTKHVRVATQKIEAAKRKGKGTRSKRGGAK